MSERAGGQSVVEFAVVLPLILLMLLGALDIWTNAGFASANFSTLAGSGNYKIGYQSLTGGLINPPGGCAGATIQVGP